MSAYYWSVMVMAVHVFLQCNMAVLFIVFSMVLLPMQAVLDITGGAVSDPMLFQSVMIEQLADQSRVLKVHVPVAAAPLRPRGLPGQISHSSAFAN